MLVSECCGALSWHLETYNNLGICNKCKENSSFTEEKDDLDEFFDDHLQVISSDSDWAAQLTNQLKKDIRKDLDNIRKDDK